MAGQEVRGGVVRGSNSAGELQLWGGREGPAKHTIPRPVTIPRQAQSKGTHNRA